MGLTPAEAVLESAEARLPVGPARTCTSALEKAQGRRDAVDAAGWYRLRWLPAVGYACEATNPPVRTRHA